jgi:hypothetical protein
MNYDKHFVTFLFVLVFGRVFSADHAHPFFCFVVEASRSSVVEIYAPFIGDWSTVLLLAGEGTMDGILK